jgi:thymidine phosphorylase
MANWLARAHAIVAPSVPANDAALPPATPEQAAELRELVAAILPDADAIARADVLRVALADAKAALTSFRLLAADVMEKKRHEARFGSG